LAIKIKSELESNKYIVKEINQNNNTILLDTTADKYDDIRRILKETGYYLDPLKPINIFGKFSIVNQLLEDETVFNKVLDKLATMKLIIKEVNFDPVEIVLDGDLKYKDEINNFIYNL
jgi:hypothetical protein